MGPVPSTEEARSVVLRARALYFAPAGGRLAAGLDLQLAPGLTWVLGDERSGKSTLLRLLAGSLAPSAGTLQWAPGVVACRPEPLDPADDGMVAGDWLQARRAPWAHWDRRAADAAADALALRPHLDKTLSMLSAGTRRKLGLLLAVASSARLTLLDQPFDALDAPSRRWLAAQLRAAAADPVRAWVVADYALPAGFDDLAACAVIDLDAGR